MYLTRAFRHAGRSTASLFLLSMLAAGAPLAAVATDSIAASPAPASAGKRVVLDGELDVLVEDFANGRSRTRHFLKTDHGRLELRFSRKPTTLPSGTRVRVRGAVEAGVMALDGAETDSMQALAAQVPYTMGEQKIAVILVNFQDDTSQPVTHEAARAKVFDTADDYYQENSFGQTWLTGDVHGWFTVPMSKTVCDAFQMADLADQQAIASGINLAAYQRKLYIFPKTACQWSGMGNLGGSQTRAWANGSTTMIVIGHELGHNLGLYHAQAINCEAAVMDGTCTNLMYGDTADLMGNYRAAHFNPFEKERLGWLNDGISPSIATVASSGRYAIEPYSSASVGTKAIKVPRGTDASGRKLWYYVEYRQPTGADAVLANTGNSTLGVIVRMATEGDPASSRQLDMSPGTSTNTYTELADGALAVGQSYTDPQANVTLTLVSTSATGAAVDVSLGAVPAPTCLRAAPDLIVSGPTVAVAAGSTVSYTVSLTNRDSSACAPTTFMLARSVPTGWTGALASGSFSLSPGTSGSTTLAVISGSTAVAGAYSIGIGSSSGAGAAHTANASATYSVAASTTVLTETIGIDKASYLRGESVYMSALVKNNGVAASGASVKFIVGLPSGTSTTLTATSGSDGYARATYKLAKGKGAAGQYVLRADAMLGTSTATAGTSFSVR